MHMDCCVCSLRSQHSLVVIADGENGRNVKFDAGWSKFSGLAHDDFSSDWLKIVHPDDRDDCELRWIQTIKDLSHQQFEFRARRHDGQYRWLLADFTPIDKTRGVTATFIDITSRKEQEITHKRQYELLCSLTDAMRAMLAYIDTERKFSYCNNGFRSVLSCSRHGICDSHVNDVFREHFIGIPEKIEEVFNGEAHHSVENMTSGPRFCFSIFPDVDDGGEVKGVYIFAAPIDEDLFHESLADSKLFVECWKKDPVGFCRFVGNAIARIGSRHLPDLHFSIAASYFSHQQICRRIDFLYDHPKDRIRGQKGKALNVLVSIEEREGVICLYDKEGDYDHLRIMLLRQDIFKHMTYGAYCFVDQNEESPVILRHLWDHELGGVPHFDIIKNSFPGTNFWNFRNADDLFSGVTVCPDCCGFYDLQASKNVADLICSCSNFAGFLE